MAELRWYVSALCPISLLRSLIVPWDHTNATCRTGLVPRLDCRIGVCVEGWEISKTYYPVGAVDAQSNALVLQRTAGVGRQGAEILHRVAVEAKRVNTTVDFVMAANLDNVIVSIDGHSVAEAATQRSEVASLPLLLPRVMGKGTRAQLWCRYRSSEVASCR